MKKKKRKKKQKIEEVIKIEQTHPLLEEIKKNKNVKVIME